MSYYGWRITWALALTQTVGYGVLYYAFSVLIAPMEAELGWSRAETTGAFSLALLFSGLIAVPVGRFVDRYGARLLMSVGSLSGALLVFAWSNVTDLWAFYLVQAGIGLVMALVFYEVAFTVIAVWFRHKRTKAMLIVTVMAGLASTIFIPLTTYLTEIYGWRNALSILALILAVTTLPLHALVLRRHPRSLGLEPDGASPQPTRISVEASVTPNDALRNPTFWWLATAFALDRIVIIAVAAHAVPMLLEQGYSSALVAAAAGTIGLMQMAGRLLFTPSTSRVSLSRLTALTFCVRALALASLLLVPNVVGLWLFAGLFGMANGASTLARAGLVAERYGSAHFGAINGSMATLIALVQTMAPLGVGALHDALEGYDPILWGLVGVSVTAAVVVWRSQHAYALVLSD